MTGDQKLDDFMRGAHAAEAGAPLSGLPFAAALGIRVIRAEAGQALLSIPYDEVLIGDPATGVLHGGVVTSLLDTCGGVAVMQSPTRPSSVATLDLRIDYMRPATPREAIYAHAACFRETRLITFVRASAFHRDPSEPVATAVGAFMVESRRFPAGPPTDGEATSGAEATS